MVGHGSEGATALFDMGDFVVGAHVLEDGEWGLLIETTADRVGCAACGVRAVGHGRRRVEVRDLPIAGRPVRLVWAKRVWRCPESLCATATWSETHDQIGRRASLTGRARVEMCRRVGEDADSVAQVAREFGIGWHSAMAAVREYGERHVEDPDRLGAPSALGLDETSFLRAGPKHPRVWITGFVDLDRHQLLDVAEGRSGQVVRDWLDDQPAEWVAASDVAVIDPFRGYATGLTDRLDATIVVDHFHAIRLANKAIDDARRRTQQETLGHLGRRDDPLYRIRRRLLVGHERLTDQQHERILTMLGHGDRHGDVTATYLAKELLRDVYDAADGPRRAPAAASLLRTLRPHRRARMPPTRPHHPRLGERGARVPHDRPLQGPTEGINLLIKKVKRVVHGFRNFNNYRLRLPLHCGVQWHTVPTAIVRGRQPRFIA